MENLTTSRIEELLLDKAVSEFLEKLKKATHGFIDVVNAYQPETDVEKQEYQDWVNNMFNVTYRVWVQSKSEKLPEFIKTRLLNNAVDRFLVSIENTKNIIDGLQESREEEF